MLFMSIQNSIDFTLRSLDALLIKDGYIKNFMTRFCHLIVNVSDSKRTNALK